MTLTFLQTTLSNLSILSISNSLITHLFGIHNRQYLPYIFKVSKYAINFILQKSNNDTTWKTHLSQWLTLDRLVPRTLGVPGEGPGTLRWVGAWCRCGTGRPQNTRPPQHCSASPTQHSFHSESPGPSPTQITHSVE